MKPSRTRNVALAMMTNKGRRPVPLQLRDDNLQGVAIPKSRHAWPKGVIAFLRTRRAQRKVELRFIHLGGRGARRTDTIGNGTARSRLVAVTLLCLPSGACKEPNAASLR